MSMMPDCYAENLGDGWVRHHDYGMITITRHGEEYIECECGKLFPEREADGQDGLCRECCESKRTCCYCGEIFEDGLKKVDGHLYCPACYAEELERTVSNLTAAMRKMAKKMERMPDEAKEFTRQNTGSTNHAIGALTSMLALAAEELAGKAGYFEKVLVERVG